MTRGIDAAAIYVPQYRVTAEAVAEAWDQAEMTGIDRTAIPAADEDAITMAVAAGARVLDGWHANRDDIESVAVATTSPPLAEDAFLGRVVRALGLAQHSETSLATGSTKAGAEALARGLDATGPVLLMVSDAPRGGVATSDHSLGAGAAAFVITDGASAPLVARGAYADERPGVRYRPAGTDAVEHVGITGYERGSVRQAVTGAAVACGDVWDDVTGLALHQPDGGLPYRMTSALPVDESTIHAGMVVGDIGDVGAATVSIGLATLCAAEGPSGACFFGGGSAEAFVFKGSLATVPGIDSVESGEEISYTSYLRMREHLGDGEVAGGGARVSLPNWQRSIPQRYRLEAGRCSNCGALNFPPGGACQSCHERAEYDEIELDPTGNIVAKTVIGQGGAPPEFARQQRRSGEFVAAIVQLEADGGFVRLPAQVVDCNPGDVEIGDTVVASFRRIYEQEGIVRYGCKFVPSRS